MNRNRNRERFAAWPTCRGPLTVLTALALGLLFGCGSGEPAHPTAPPQPPVKAPPPPPAPPAATASTSSPSPAPTASTSPPPPAAASKLPGTVEQKAQVGAGKKIRLVGKSILGTEFASLYATRERLVFEVQIPEAMKLFKATEDRAPKTHEEFMEKIIKANNIHLPELPEGDQYRYDPKTEQLMVDSPAPE